jgi:steroid delta-isomerase-like uncharacterized protein
MSGKRSRREKMKKLICVVPLILLLCFTFACQDKAAIRELEKLKAQRATEAQNKDLVRNFWAAIDKNDFGKLKEITADDFAINVPGLNEPLRLETMFQAIKTHYAAFPDWKHTIEDMMAEGDKVAVRLLQNGTHRAVFEGIPATDKKVTMPTQCLMVIDKGKVRELWAVEDNLGVYLQLGMELKPVETKNK